VTDAISAHYRNAQGLVWVNVASSVYVLEDFVNVDNHLFMRFLWAYPALKFLVPGRYRPQFEQYRAARAKAPLLRRDCRKPLPFPDESVDHILCSHFLEHIYPDQAMACLRDFRRALKPGGTAHIIVPDFRVLIDTYLAERAAGEADAAGRLVEAALLSQRSRPSFKYRWMEFGGGFGLQHRWMYDAASMAHAMTTAGFTLVEGNDTPSKTYRENDGSVHLVGRAS
jgi:SAM-dependent methyltransferase